MQEASDLQLDPLRAPPMPPLPPWPIRMGRRSLLQAVGLVLVLNACTAAAKTLKPGYQNKKAPKTKAPTTSMAGKCVWESACLRGGSSASGGPRFGSIEMCAGGRSCTSGTSSPPPSNDHTTAKKYPLSVLYGGFPESIVAPAAPPCNVLGATGAPTTTNFVITYVAKVKLG